MRQVASIGSKYRVNDQSEERNPMAEAFGWVARVSNVALMMVLPGLAGQWLDKKFGTNFLVLVGFVFGLTSGFWYLLKIARVSSKDVFPGDQNAGDDEQ